MDKSKSKHRRFFVEEQIDNLCDAFEAELKAGRKPAIGDYVERAIEFEPSVLFRELLLIKLEYAHGDKAPHQEAYSLIYPEFNRIIEEVFSGAKSDTKVNLGETLVDTSTSNQLHGRYQLIEQIGSGAFGTVYRAHDLRLDRQVAVKLGHLGDNADSETLKRFEREAKSAAQLSHPGIVPVFEYGTSVFGPFIVAEFVEGLTLDEIKPLEGADRFVQIAGLTSAIAKALSHAHQHGVIHRDIKPSNLIVANVSSESPPVPKILDFGLARRFQGEASLTTEGQVIGTPSYMSPEQARGDGREVDGRSDIYSLGVVLFRQLTGQLPFTGRAHIVLHRVINSDPPDARDLDGSIPNDLAVICNKCIEKDPNHRYQTADELAEDLDRWLTNRPIDARPTSRLTRAVRWVRRRPALTAAVISVILLAATLSSTVPVLRSRNQANLRLFQSTVDSLLSAKEDRFHDAFNETQVLFPSIEPILIARLETNASPRATFRILSVLARTSETPPVQLPDIAWEQAAPYELRTLASGLKPRDIIGLREKCAAADEADQRSWLNLCCVLSICDPDGPAWPPNADRILRSVCSLDASEAQAYGEILRPLKDVIGPGLHDVFRQDPDGNAGMVAAHLLATFHCENKKSLAELIRCAGPKQHSVLTGHAVDAIDPEIFLSTMKHSDVEDEIRADANALTALISIGNIEPAIPFLAGSADPRLQTYLIHVPAECKVHPDVLIEALTSNELAPQSMYALILALGQFENIVPPNSIVEWLKSRYQSHPSAAVHSASRWLLTRWGFTSEVARMDSELIEQGYTSERDWFHDSLNHCMVIFHPPSGSASPFEVDGATVPWTFAISSTETTYRQFRMFDANRKRDEVIASNEECPITQVSWQDAMRFCRWLSDHESGRPITGRVHDTTETTMTVQLDKPGYRLPTNLEWEFACRAGTRSVCFFGDRKTPYGNSYAHGDSATKACTVGIKMPNQLGIFDIYGNAHEWTTGKWRSSQHEQDIRTVTVDSADENDILVHRGGSWFQRTDEFHSRWRLPARGPNVSLGFRVVRVLPNPLKNHMENMKGQND